MKIDVLNLGAGVQSTTLALMMSRGELPRPDVAIFADTGWEPRAVYDHLGWLRGILTTARIPLQIVDNGNIRDDALRSQVRGQKTEDGGRWASLPMYTRKVWTPADIPQIESLITEHDGSAPDDGYVDLFGDVRDRAAKYRDILHELKLGRNVTQMGMIRRQCTKEYKIEPIERFVKRELLGLEPRQRVPTGTLVRHWMGITADEAQRMKPAREWWREHVYPFCQVGDESFERPWTRRDCIRWLEMRYPQHTVPRSACIGCPFHSDDEWRRLRDETPDEWADAVAFDEAIRHCGGMRGEMFLHRSCVPLSEAEIDGDTGQPSLFGQECEGMCGV